MGLIALFHWSVKTLESSGEKQTQLGFFDNDNENHVIGFFFLPKLLLNCFYLKADESFLSICY